MSTYVMNEVCRFYLTLLFYEVYYLCETVTKHLKTNFIYIYANVSRKKLNIHKNMANIKKNLMIYTTN